MRKVLAIFLLAALGTSGCAQVQMDVAGAQQLAQQSGDTVAATCFGALAPLVSKVPQGLLSKFETYRLANGLAQGPCAPLLGQLSVHLLEKSPFVP